MDLGSIILTVGMSIVLHGVSAAPLAAAYGAYVARSGECAEKQEVTAMPLNFRVPDGGDE